MPLFLRPDSNVTQTSWTNGYLEIDEATASDTDFSYGANNSNSATLEVGLSNPVGSSFTGTCTVRWRYAKVSSGTLSGTGGTVTQTCAIRQGSTAIASSTVTTSGSWTAGSFTFNAADITDWTDVRLRFTQSSSGGGGNARGSAVSWAEVEIPNQTISLTETEAGTASITAAATITQVIQSTLNGAGSVAAIPFTTAIVSASFSSAATITALVDLQVNNGIRFTESSDRRVAENGDVRVLQGYASAGVLLDAISSLAGSGAISAAAIRAQNIASSIAGSGTTAFIADRSVSASVSLVGSLATISASTVTRGALSVLAGTGTIAGTALVSKNFIASLSAAGAAQAKLGFQHTVSSSQSAAGTFTTQVTVIRNAAASRTAAGSFVAIASLTMNASRSFSGQGTLAGDADVGLLLSFAAQANGSLGANETFIKGLSASLSGYSDFGISPQIIRAVATLVGSTGAVVAVPITASNIVSSLTSTGLLNGSPKMILSAEFKPTIDRRVTQNGDVRITNTGDFRVISDGTNMGISTGSPVPTIIPFVNGLFAKKNGVWGAVTPRIYRGGSWVEPKVYVKQSGIWKRVY